MVNIDDFTSKLEKILDYYSLTASSFADKIGVQRSSMSHLLSGRNKPSLDFVLKIVDEFKEVDLYWLLLGKGEFPKNEISSNPTPLQLINKNIEKARDLFDTEEVENSPVQEIENENLLEKENNKAVTNSSPIEKIVIFYKNGTFKNYNPE